LYIWRKNSKGYTVKGDVCKVDDIVSCGITVYDCLFDIIITS